MIRIIIPAINVHSRVAETDNVETWARLNNLHLNLEKCAEILFTSLFAVAWHRPSVFVEDTRSHCVQPSVCRRPRAERHQFLCSDSARSEIAPCTRIVWRNAPDGIPNCRRLEVAVRCQRMVGVHHGRRSAAHWRFSTPWCPCRLPPCGRADGRPAGRRLQWQPVQPGPVHKWPRSALLPNRRTNSHALRDQRHDFLLSCRLRSLTDTF